MSMSLIVRIFQRGYKTTEAGREVIDKDCADAYEFMRRMYRALGVARGKFEEYGEHHRAKADGRLTLVETQQAIAKAEANEELVRLIDAAMGQAFQSEVASDWLRIETIDKLVVGRRAALLGRKGDGGVYTVISQWLGHQWEIESQEGFQPPTHWAPVEKLPVGY
ncbi:MAG: hypothetical protein WC829_05875 [Hyphomicrobium sp.]|jgi:hypothetical protein